MGLESSLVLDPIYATLGVEATLSILADDTVTVIDKTAGVELFDAKRQMATIRQVAAVRVAELTDKSIARADLQGTSITMNDKTLRIDSTRPKPGLAGEATGELYLILSE